MKENSSALWSEYIIDGVRMDTTPGAMLQRACDAGEYAPEEPSGQIIDESIDPSPVSASPLDRDPFNYLSLMRRARSREVPVANCDAFTQGRMATALLDAIWKEGHFRLGDLALSICWRWNGDRLGNMAAFYSSVESACDTADDVGICLRDCKLISSPELGIEVKAALSGVTQSFDEADGEDELFFEELPFQTEHPHMKDRRKCPLKASGKEGNWIIYIPFDTCPHNLGGSLLAQVTSEPCGKAVELESPDYFIDCYEVVRELVEDGIAVSGITISDGGLLQALRLMVPENAGFDAEFGDVMKSYGETELARLLFSELPGVLLEITADDYDYIDAELLLQDVAYYPLGAFKAGGKGLRLLSGESNGISGILHSLLNVQVSEGED